MSFQMNSDHKTKKMTEGNPFLLLILFALPLMAGNVFQQLYTVTDTAIVGQALGVDALAALGTVAWTLWLVIGMIQGMTQGFSIRIAQKFGAGDLAGVKKAAGHSITLCVLAAVCLTVLAQLAVRPVEFLLKIPVEVVPMAEVYLRIFFSGIPVLTAYNLLASMLRAVGDAKTPLVAMVIASMANIGLDLLFVLVFHWGMGGAAGATVFAQFLSALFCFWKIREIRELRVETQTLVPEGKESRKLCMLAMPVAAQNLVISIGGMIVQAVVNRYGVIFIAGYTATNQLYGILEVAAISYGYAMTTYAGQNMGAGNPERIVRGVRAGLLISMITSALIALLMVTCGQTLLGLFIQSDSLDRADVMAIAYRYLLIMSLCLPVLYVLHIVRSCIQGMGNTVVPMLSGIAEFIMRTGSALALPLLFGENGILFAEVIAWLGADLILIPGYFRQMSRVKKTGAGY